MPTCKTDLEIKLFNALKRIAQYDTAERIVRKPERWGLDDGKEALIYSYENVQQEAKDAVRGVRAPRK